jgi:protein SCO1/2
MLLLGWREELKEGFRRILHLWTGRVAVGVVLILAGIGLYLVGMRIAYAKREIPRGVPDALPEDYPVVSLELPDLEYQVIEGEKRNLKELEGPAILSFFYAHCATVCPVTISGVLSAKKELLATGREVRTVLLLTLDPHRDTLERLKEYRRRWEKEDDPRVLWGRADPQTLEDALRRLNYSFERDPRSGEIAHPPFVYLIGREGRVRMILSQPIPRWIREGMERISKHSP